jgi:hypothetical protein
LESVPLEGVPSVAAPSEPVIREKVPTRQMGVVPRRSSTRAEKMNLTEDPPSRDFIESHKKEIQDGLRRQIEAARRVATLENDPKRLSEIQTRIRSAERSLAEIEAVDPGNATTWNVGEKKSPSK